MRIGLGQGLMDDVISGQGGDSTSLATDPTYALASGSSLPASTTGLSPTQSNFLTTGVLPANAGSASSNTLLYLGLAVVGVIAFMGMSKR